MIRGSTPMHVFDLPIGTDQIKALRLTYVQGDKTVFEKTEQDVAFDGNAIRLRLTQEETLAFAERYPVKIQLKVLTIGGNVLPSQIFSVTVGEILNEEVLE